MRAIEQRACLPHVLGDVERAQQHVDAIADGPGDAEFLRLGRQVQVDGLPIQQVGAGEIGILIVVAVGLPVGGDRGQRPVADVVIDLRRQTHVLDIVERAVIGVDHAGKGIGRVRHLAAQRQDRGRCQPALYVDDGAAVLVDGIVVGDQPDREPVTIVDQQLAAHEPAVTVIDAVARAAILEKPVPLVEPARDAGCDHVVDRTGDISLADDLVVAAIGQLSHGLQVELGFLRGDGYHACRRVLAEQGRLRPAQHLDTADVGQVGDLRSGAAAIDAVHENTDGWFDTRVVGAIAETANEEIGVGDALPLADLERRHHRLQILEVADLVALKLLRAGDGDGHGGFLQGRFALGRGHDDAIAIRDLVLLDLVAHLGAFLGKSGHGQGECRRRCSHQKAAGKAGNAGSTDCHQILHPLPVTTRSFCNRSRQRAMGQRHLRACNQ